MAGRVAGAGSGCPVLVVDPAIISLSQWWCRAGPVPTTHISQLSGFLMILLQLSCQSSSRVRLQHKQFQRWWVLALSWPGPAPPPAPGQTNVIMQLHHWCWCVGEPDGGVQPQPDPHHYHPITSISVSLYLDNVEIHLNIIVFRNVVTVTCYWLYCASMHQRFLQFFIRFLQSFIKFLHAAVCRT